MKKLTLMLVLFALALFTAVQPTRAAWDENEIAWSVDNDGTNYWLVGGILLPEGVDSIELTLPLNPYTTITNGVGDETRIEFRQGTTDTIESLIFEDWLGDEKVYTYYDISLTMFDMELNDDALGRDIIPDADHLYIIIQLTTDATFDHSDMLTYYAAQAEITFHLSPPDYRDVYFIKGDSTYLYTYGDLPDGTTSMIFDYFAGNMTTLAYDNASSTSNKMRLLDGIDLVTTMYFDDYRPQRGDPLVIPFGDYSPDVPDQYIIYIYPQSANNEYIDMTTINMFNRNFTIEYNADLTTVSFYSQGSLYSTSSFVEGTIPTAPATDPTPPTNFEFIGWRTADGSLFDFEQPFDDNLINNGEIELTAVFRATSASDEYTTTDPTPTDANDFYNLASGIGFANDTGFTLLYLGVIGAATVGLLMAGLPTFATLLVDVLITGFFTFMGFLPLLVAALGFATISLMLVFTFKGGD